MLVSITAGLDLTAYASTSGDYEYEVLDDGTVGITTYNGSTKDLSIPSKLGGYTVTEIWTSAFFESTSLKSITIPDSVTTIEDFAFSCSKLTKITVNTIL